MACRSGIKKFYESNGLDSYNCICGLTICVKCMDLIGHYPEWYDSSMMGKVSRIIYDYTGLPFMTAYCISSFLLRPHEPKTYNKVVREELHVDILMGMEILDDEKMKILNQSNFEYVLMGVDSLEP
eukprot:UN03786